MYKDFDMGNQDITNVKNITAAGNIFITSPAGDTVVEASGDLRLNSTTGTTILEANGVVEIRSDTSYISLLAAAGQNVQIQSPLDMSNQNILGATSITGLGNIAILSPAGDTVIDANGDLTLNSATGSTTLEGNAEVVISSDTSYVSLTAAAGQNVKIQSPLDMSNNNITGGNTITGTTALTLATLSNGNLNLSPNGTGLIEANKGIDMNDNTIVGASTITGTTALTLATLSNGNLNLSPNGTGLIEANKGIDMNNNTIVGGNTITGTTTLTLASTGNNNINISPAGTGQVVINKQVNFSSQTLFNMTLTNCDGLYGRPTGALVLISQQAVSPAVQIRGALTMWANSTTQAPGNSIAGLTTLTGQTTLGLATLSNGDLSLSPMELERLLRTRR
jgi:hypothetical protein